MDEFNVTLSVIDDRGETIFYIEHYEVTRVDIYRAVAALQDTFIFCYIKEEIQKVK